MDAGELETIIASDRIMSAVTWGVFRRSVLPKSFLPGAYVFNSRDAPGEHWLLLYVPNNAPIELYDSLNRSPVYYGLCPSIKTLPARLQGSDSSSCGLFVLFFLFWRSRGIDMHTLYLTLCT